MKTKKSNASEIQKRRKILRDKILYFQRRGMVVDRKSLLDELEKEGFEIDFATLYRDRKTLNMGNTFVEDLTQLDNYSSFMKETFDKICLIERRSFELFNKNYLSSRLTRGPWRDGPSRNIAYQEMRDRLRGLGC